jgi:succinoglycan biosynthesis transport protein ExoP
VAQTDNPPLSQVSEIDFVPASPTFGERLDFILGFLRRRYLSIVICLLLSLPVGAWRYFTTPASYTATATMMIETRRSPLQSLLGEPLPDASWIESQIGVLKSQSVAAYVVKQLRLAEDPDFVRSAPGLLDRVRARLGLEVPPPPTDGTRTADAINKLRSQLDVRRIGQSYMMNIEFHSDNPDQAVKIANAMIDGFIYDQLNAKYQSNRRASDWLQERLQNLREQTASAERAVIEFKAKNNIVTAGGTLMSEKQLTDFTAQLAAARTRTAELKARFDRIHAVHEAYQQERPASTGDEEISEAMSNGIISNLRGQYLELVNKEADWSVRYGKNHYAVVNLRNQIRDIRKSIRDELGRIEESVKSEYEIAKKRENDSEKGLASIVSQSNDTNQAQVALFSLEAAAQSYRKLYDSFLQQYTESVQQQSYPISDARPVSAASAIKSGPQIWQSWALTIFLGGLFGGGIGILREKLDRGVRTKEQVRSLLDTNCLGLVPLLTNLGGKSSNAVAAPLPGSRGSTRVGSLPGTLRAAFDEPFSPYVEAIRAVKVTLDLNRKPGRPMVTGVISCLPNEGKSSIAAAMAMLIAQSGARVILVDCDVRNPSLSRALAPSAEIGLMDVLAGRAAFSDAIWTIPNTSMAFLPMVHNSALPNALEMLASEATETLFSLLRVKYDYVIVDLPPLVAGVDVHVTSRIIESYLLVIEWGATKIDFVKHTLRSAPRLQERIIGTVLNKVDMTKVRRYTTYGASYSYGRDGYTRPSS